MTWHPSFLLPDDVLFGRRLSAAPKVVHGVTLGYPNRNPSLTQLRDATGLRRNTIAAAQRELDEEHTVWIEEEDDTLTESAWRLVEYDRPEAFHDRYPGSHRFNRSNKVVAVEPWANPHHPMNADRWTELPGTILARLPGGTKNTALIRLVALAYAREQLIRGAIQVEDEVLAARLGVAPAQVRRVREKLVAARILVPYRRRSPATIYTMPGGTPIRPAAPRDLDPGRTKRLRVLSIYVDQPVFATDAQYEHASRLIQRIGEPAAFLCLFSAASELECDRPGDIEPLLDLLVDTAANPPRIIQFEPREDVGTLVPIATENAVSHRLGIPTAHIEDTGLLPPSSEPKNLYAAAPRDGLTTEEEPGLDARLDDGGSGQPDEERLSDDAGCGESASRPTDVPLSVAARLEELFPGRTHRLRREAERALSILDEGWGLHNAERRRIAEDALHAQIDRAKGLTEDYPRELYGRLRGALKYLPRDEATVARLRSASHEPDDPPSEEMIEVDVAELLASAGSPLTERA